MQKLKHSLHPGVFLVLGVLALGMFGAVKSVFEAGAATAPSQVIIPNSTPVVSQIVLNAGNSITLIGNTTKTVSVSFVVTDNNGCNDIFLRGSITAVVYRSGISGGSSCAASTLGCYRMSTTTQNSCAANATTTQATSTFELYYFADATDSSSSYPAQDWVAYISAVDESGANHTATSTHVELNTITSIDTSTSSVNYGQVNPNTNTGSTNQVVGVKNAGNASTTISLNAQQTLMSGSNSISTSSQHYATSTFTYGGSEQELSGTAAQVSGFLISRPPITTWGTNTAFPSTIQDQGAAAYNEFLYTTGGTVGGALSTNVYYSRVSATGTLSAWTTTTALPNALDDHVTVAYNGYLYHIGGILSGTATSGVLYAPIQSSGTVGSWLSTTALPTGREEHSGAVYNGYIYVSGGNAPATATSSVLFAQINSDGTIGSWTNTTALPDTLIQHSMVAYNNFLYSTGGTILGTISSTVWVAPINTTGSIGSWTVTAAIPSGLNEHSAVVNDGLLYLTGGTPLGGGNTSTVYFAPLNTSGSVGAWTTTAPLPAAFDDHVAVTYNGYLYTLGGSVSAVDTSTVFYAPIATRNTYWGLAVPGGTPIGDYTSTNVFSQIFQP